MVEVMYSDCRVCFEFASIFIVQLGRGGLHRGATEVCMFSTPASGVVPGVSCRRRRGRLRYYYPVTSGEAVPLSFFNWLWRVKGLYIAPFCRAALKR